MPDQWSLSAELAHYLSKTGEKTMTDYIFPSDVCRASNQLLDEACLEIEDALDELKEERENSTKLKQFQARASHQAEVDLSDNACCNVNDPEKCGGKARDIIITLLRHLGHGKVAEMYEATPRYM